MHMWLHMQKSNEIDQVTEMAKKEDISSDPPVWESVIQKLLHTQCIMMEAPVLSKLKFIIWNSQT